MGLVDMEFEPLPKKGCIQFKDFSFFFPVSFCPFLSPHFSPSLSSSFPLFSPPFPLLLPSLPLFLPLILPSSFPLLPSLFLYFKIFRSFTRFAIAHQLL